MANCNVLVFFRGHCKSLGNLKRIIVIFPYFFITNLNSRSIENRAFRIYSFISLLHSITSCDKLRLHFLRFITHERKEYSEQKINKLINVIPFSSSLRSKYVRKMFEVNGLTCIKEHPNLFA